MISGEIEENEIAKIGLVEVKFVDDPYVHLFSLNLSRLMFP